MDLFIFVRGRFRRAPKQRGLYPREIITSTSKQALASCFNWFLIKLQKFILFISIHLEGDFISGLLLIDCSFSLLEGP